MDYITNQGLIIEKNTNNTETNLAKIRRLSGYSQASLAAKAGISLRTLQQYESKARDINKASILTLNSLARALECTIDSIIDIHIDAVTDCVVNRETGAEFETAYELVTRNITKAEAENDIRHGWKFNWHDIQSTGYDIIELFTPHDNKTQGRISFKKMDGYYFVDHVESSPRNVGKTGVYYGVGANLFAIICYLSKKDGFGGYVSFNSKKDPKVIENYISNLHATQIGHSQRMILDETAANRLIEKYKLEKENHSC